MTSAEASRLNESGEHGEACVVKGGAVHTSRSQRTTQHGHHAWKVHVGLDAPVWVKPRDRGAVSEARVIVVPPNVQHATGAFGWSVALFLEPGSRATPWRETGPAYVIDGVRARRLVDEAMISSRVDIGCFVDQVARATFARSSRPGPLDTRVGAALTAIRRDVEVDLRRLASALGLSIDRLTHLVSEQTGMPLRRHALWQRLLRVLSAGVRPAFLAAAAVEAGFSDHAHMTRSFRRFLGRAPSEFRVPPRVIAPWTCPTRQADALDLVETMARARLRREHPGWGEDELDAQVLAWLHERPGAEHGDADGVALKPPFGKRA
jgi:AraC-like DNA-binding protein